MKFMTIVLLFLFHNGSACWFGDNDIVYCTNPGEISTQGTKQWQKLKIYNNYKTLHLKKDGLTRLIGLHILELNNVDSIEENSFNKVDQLKELYIQNSNLEVISTGILDNLPIKKLFIERTNLKYIFPGVLENLPQIELFSLHNNSIKQVHKGVFSNIRLKKLYLSNNGLEKISPGAFENMSQLIELSLRGNLLNSFNSNLLLGTSESLRNLWLSNNTFTKLSKDMFTTIPNLKKLYLELNQIETIERDTFEMTPNLEILDLSNNKLRTVQTNMFPFDGMKNLNYFALHNNQLTFIPIAAVRAASNLKYITYGGNPFQCKCSVELDNFVVTRNITRICDNQYLNGERPSCTFSKFEPKQCLYDEDFSIELFELYQQVIKEYPKLELKCDLSNGPSKAVLREFDIVDVELEDRTIL